MADYTSAYTGAQIDAGIGQAGTAVQPGSLATVATTGAYADLSGKPTLGTLSSQNANALSLTGSVTEAVFALTDAATINVSPANGTIQTLVLAGTARTLTFTGMDAGQAITLMINDGTAGTITTWNATFVNNGGAAPTLSTTAYTVVTLWKVDTVVYAAVVGG